MLQKQFSALKEAPPYIMLLQLLHFYSAKRLKVLRFTCRHAGQNSLHENTESTFRDIQDILSRPHDYNF